MKNKWGGVTVSRCKGKVEFQAGLILTTDKIKRRAGDSGERDGGRNND